MPNPFPGMNPYLENPDLWPQVHHLLISSIFELLVPQLLPKYIVDIEKRIYELRGENSLLVGIPDVTVLKTPIQTNPPSSNIAVVAPPATAVKVRVPVPVEFREAYLEVKDTETKEVVTVIEVLSPANKRSGKGREMHEEKREKVFGSRAHMVEIDLLRTYKPLPVFGEGIESSYRILVSRREWRPIADLYVFNLPDIIPAFPLPLRGEDAELIVDLQALLNAVYDRAAYDFRIDYTAEPIPPLSESDAIWADTWLRERGLRESSVNPLY